jgi:hypothetical protein
MTPRADKRMGNGELPKHREYSKRSFRPMGAAVCPRVTFTLGWLAHACGIVVFGENDAAKP